MKKMLLLCTGLLLAAGIASAQVTSKNIVGYLKTPATGVYTPSGPTFVQVLTCTNTTGEAQWRLGDITVSNMRTAWDYIQILDPETADTLMFATYSANGLGGNPDLKGWWEYPTALNNRLDDKLYGFGTGFLTCLDSEDVVFTYTGEVMTDPVTVDCSGLIYPLIANILPQDITLGDITVSGMRTAWDYIQILDPDTAETLVFATYSANGLGGNPALKGWWEYPTALNNQLDGMPLKAGQAFLGCFDSDEIKIHFPSPLALTP